LLFLGRRIPQYRCRKGKGRCHGCVSDIINTYWNVMITTVRWSFGIYFGKLFHDSYLSKNPCKCERNLLSPVCHDLTAAINEAYNLVFGGVMYGWQHSSTGKVV